jgi:acyl-CoA reductase-like NAD-dependent aldehyde dehydrogenase
MNRRLTRRAWAATVTATAAAAAAPQMQTPTGESQQLLDEARQQIRERREELAKYSLDRTVQPAFRFEA